MDLLANELELKNTLKSKNGQKSGVSRNIPGRKGPSEFFLVKGLGKIFWSIPQLDLKIHIHI